MAYRDLYPPVEAYQIDRLRVDDIHELYIEQSGNPDGVPVVFLHGGPGGGSSPGQRRFFDPKRYRIVNFDQRGAGKSTPLGETRNNNTALLVGDMEAIREKLGIDRWHLFGGSWGATLALAYAQTHPDRCLGLILRGIFLMRPWEIDWFLYGMGTIFPEAWRSFAAFIPEGERHDLLQAYSRRLHDADPAKQLAAARSWSLYEGACSSLVSNPYFASHYADPVLAIGLARLEAHYMATDIYDGTRDLMRHIDRMRHIPGVIVQGRYDIICPIKTADELHRAWPEAQYIIIPDGGHSAIEPGARTALLEATDRFAKENKA
jgi:proline iminopeptidase